MEQAKEAGGDMNSLYRRPPIRIIDPARGLRIFLLKELVYTDSSRILTMQGAKKAKKIAESLNDRSWW